MDPAFPSIVDALEEHGLGEEIATGANLSADEALEHVAALTRDWLVNPAQQDDHTRRDKPARMRDLSAG
jgi:hypothetical protein